MNPTLPKSIERSAGLLAEIVGQFSALAYAYANGNSDAIQYNSEQMDKLAYRLGDPATLLMLDQAGSDLKEIYNRTK